jgi:hypothetical protein
MTTISLDVFTTEPKQLVRSTVPDPKMFPLVHPGDIAPLGLIGPTANGPWIAGGATLQWYQNRELEHHDIDVFCASAEQADQLAQRLTQHGTVKYQSNNAITYEMTHWVTNEPNSQLKKWSIQVIKRKYFDSVDDVIDSFDITVCQIGFDGKNWHLGRWTGQDIRQRNLRMILPLLPDAAKRLTKYWTYGYRPVPGLLRMIANNPESRWEFNPLEDYPDAF